jgi:hypothetical protein
MRNEARRIAANIAKLFRAFAWMNSEVAPINERNPEDLREVISA